MGKLGRWFRWLAAASMLLFLLLLALTCADIYTSGMNARTALPADQMMPVYQMDDVRQRLQGLMLPFLAMVLFQLAAFFTSSRPRASLHIRTARQLYRPCKGKAAGWIRPALLTVAFLFILLGVMNGGIYDVLVKAVNICTECIGLG